MSKIAYILLLLACLTVCSNPPKTQEQPTEETKAAETPEAEEPDPREKEWEKATKNVTRRRQHSKAMAQKIAEQSNDFGIKLYKTLATQRKDGNILFSPASLHLSLGMLYAGATQQNKAELGKVLGVQNLENPSAYHLEFQKSLPADIANALWISNQNDFKVKPDYQKKIEHDFESKIFVGKLASTTVQKEISDWVSQATKKHITQIPQLSSEREGLVLISNIFFEDAWKLNNDFSASKTQPAPFFITPQMPITVSFMNKTEGAAKYFVGDKFEMVALPHEHTRTSFCIILPNPDVPLATLENTLTAQNIQSWIEKTNYTAIERLSIPKIFLDDEISPKEALQLMGAKSVFDDVSAHNFDEISTTPLFVNKIIQKTHLSVDEKGTTAASSTTTEAIPVKSQLPRKNKVNLVANRPFIFLVYDDEGKSILFFGRLVRPK